MATHPCCLLSCGLSGCRNLSRPTSTLDLMLIGCSAFSWRGAEGTKKQQTSGRASWHDSDGQVRPRLFGAVMKVRATAGLCEHGRRSWKQWQKKASTSRRTCSRTLMEFWVTRIALSPGWKKRMKSTKNLLHK